jgi:hypothetical protein
MMNIQKFNLCTLVFWNFFSRTAGERDEQENNPSKHSDHPLDKCDGLITRIFDFSKLLGLFLGRNYDVLFEAKDYYRLTRESKEKVRPDLLDELEKGPLERVAFLFFKRMLLELFPHHHW